MKTTRIIKSVTRAAAVIALATLIQPPLVEAAGKLPRPHVELKIDGAIFTVPDQTARAYPIRIYPSGTSAAKEVLTPPV